MHIINKKIDFLFIKFPIIFPIIYTAILYLFPKYENFLILFTILLLAEPHFGATWPTLVSKNNRSIIKDNFFLYIIIPLLIIIFCFFLYFYFLNFFYLIFYLANFFHVTRQSAGISKIYVKDSNEKNYQIKLIYIYSSILFLIGFFRFFFKKINIEDLFILNTSMLLIFILILFIYIKKFGLNNIFTLITGLIIFYPICFVSNPIHAIIMGVTMHYSQYLLITYKLSKKRDPIDAKKKILIFLIIYSIVMTALSLNLNSSNEILSAFLVIPITFQMLHFYFDSLIWRLSNPKIRETIFPYLFNK
jgi:hypothetical protein